MQLEPQTLALLIVCLLGLTSVSFSDSATAGTADNTVIGTITFSGETLSADVSHSLQIDTVAAVTAMLWTGYVNVYGQGIGQPGWRNIFFNNAR